MPSLANRLAKRLVERRGPFCAQFRIGLVMAARLRTLSEPVAIQPAERPNRGAAHQWRFIVEQLLGFRSEIGIAGIADGDQHIADETRAPDALDRAFSEQGAEC